MQQKQLISLRLQSLRDHLQDQKEISKLQAADLSKTQNAEVRYQRQISKLISQRDQQLREECSEIGKQLFAKIMPHLQEYHELIAVREQQRAWDLFPLVMEKEKSLARVQQHSELRERENDREIAIED